MSMEGTGSGLVFNRLPSPPDQEETMIEATDRLWLTADRSELVPEGDERAAFLFCTPGQQISDADAEKYGLTGGKTKKKAPGEDKQADVGEDK